MDFDGDLRSNLNFNQILSPIQTLKTLKILKIKGFSNFREEALQFIMLLENLEELKIKSDSISLETFLRRYIRNNTEILKQKTLLKKLSLNAYYDEIFNDLDCNIGLEKFSLKPFKNPNIFTMPNFLKYNYNLKCIKLPDHFCFDESSLLDFLHFIQRSKTLEELHVNQSVLSAPELFISVIKCNKSLKILALNHFNQEGYTLATSSNIVCDFFYAIANTSIEDLSLTTIIYNKAKIYFKKMMNSLSPIEFRNQIKKLHKSLNYLLSKSNKLRKIDIRIPDIPYKYVKKFAELIIKHVKIGNIECFAGYDLKMLMENKIDIMTIRKKGNKLSNNSCILVEIIRKFLGKADKIFRIISQSQCKSEIYVDKFMESISRNERLIINSEKTNVIAGSYSPLHYFSMLVISKRIINLKELDIRNYKLNCYQIILPKLLKNLKSLEKLKFLTVDCEKNNLIKIFKAIFSLKNISLINWDLISKNNLDFTEIFNGLAKHQSLRKFKLENSGFKIENYNTLENFVAQSRLISLNLYEINFTYDSISQLANGLKRNNTITRLRLEKLQNNKIEDPIELITGFLEILEILESKKYYERISMFFKNKVKEKSIMADDMAEFFLSKINNILLNNRKLEEFNVFLIIPFKYFLKYSEILSNAYENSEILKTINFIDLKSNLSDFEKTSAIVKEWYIRGYPFICGSSKVIYNYCFYKLMGVFIIDFIKKCKPLIAYKIAEILIKIDNAKTVKKLYLNMEYANNFSDVYKLNLLENFFSLEELNLSIYMNSFTKLALIERNLQKLEYLHTIKFTDSMNGDDNFTVFFSAKNLTYLKLFNSNIKQTCLEDLSEKIKSSKLEKLTLKNIDYMTKDCRNESFLYLIKAITCSSLKKLKIYIAYTPELLNILIDNLEKFTSLECIGISLSENYESFNIPIKNLISVLQDENTSLYKLKVNNYVWNIKNIRDKVELEINRCRLNPADLIVLREICERKIMPILNSINLSDNIGIVDKNFVESMTRIIIALGHCEIIIRNSECNQEHVVKIKNLLGYARSSLLKIQIS
ncbi:hypothetical protein SteCoe_9862 [Stentor coeruleus]|uniref:Uncharacterized protein n=1 Tax=Stentor coeruleus TaxID=5963 RepID=A0A1R2CGW8_9CILI|nr:hypothetical protein SteCoe_9862 [Stentor coeruleus]